MPGNFTLHPAAAFIGHLHPLWTLMDSGDAVRLRQNGRISCRKLNFFAGQTWWQLIAACGILLLWLLRLGWKVLWLITNKCNRKGTIRCYWVLGSGRSKILFERVLMCTLFLAMQLQLVFSLLWQCRCRYAEQQVPSAGLEHCDLAIVASHKPNFIS